MANREQLLDINVYGKGMATHIKAQSKPIGDYIKENCYKSYGDIQFAKVPTSVMKTFEGGNVRLYLPEFNDPRTGSSYGRAAFDNRGSGFFDDMGRSAYETATMPNVSVFLCEGLSDGIHLVMPRFVGQQKLDNYMLKIRDEATWFFKNYLKPTQRRVRIFIEDFRTE